MSNVNTQSLVVGSGEYTQTANINKSDVMIDWTVIDHQDPENLSIVDVSLLGTTPVMSIYADIEGIGYIGLDGNPYDITTMRNIPWSTIISGKYKFIISGIESPYMLHIRTHTR